MDSLESQAKFLGIPMKIAIDDNMRYSYCNASMADLHSIEGKKMAVYRGECICGHHYEIRREIQELQQSLQVLNGELTLGNSKGFVADDLEEF